MNREQLIEAAETAWRMEQEEFAELRVWLCAHLGLSPETRHETVEALILTAPGEMTDGQLGIRLHHKLGLPPGVVLSEEQLAQALHVERPDLLGARGGLSVTRERP
jgi:hypothetical protein